LAIGKRKPRRGAEEVRTFGGFIKAHRRARGWTQKELCKRARIDGVTLYQIERDIRTTSIVGVCKIAKAMDLDLHSVCDYALRAKIKRYTKKYYRLFLKHEQFNGQNSKIPIRVNFDLHVKGLKYQTDTPRTGRWLQNKRIAAQKTLKGVHAETGIHHRNLHSYEHGKKNISFRSLFLLSECLGFSPTDLFHMLLQEKIENCSKSWHHYVDLFIKEFGDVDEKQAVIDIKNQAPRKGPKPKQADNAHFDKRLITLKYWQAKTRFATFFTNLKEVRELTFEEMGNQLGLLKQQVKEYAYCHRIPSLRRIIRICDTFGLDYQEVFEMVFQDRIDWYEYRHRKIFESLLSHNAEDPCVWALRFAEESVGRYDWRLPETAKILRELRAKTGLSQDYLAMEVDCSISTVQKSELGFRTPTPLLIIGLCKMTGYDPMSLLNTLLKEKLTQSIEVYKKAWKEMIEGVEDAKRNACQAAFG